jgi:hypothetical protein
MPLYSKYIRTFNRLTHIRKEIKLAYLKKLEDWYTPKVTYGLNCCKKHRAPKAGNTNCDRSKRATNNCQRYSKSGPVSAGITSGSHGLQ